MPPQRSRGSRPSPGSHRRAAGRRQKREAGLPIRLGAFEIRKSGLARFDWRDPYHVALSVSWRQFFAALLALEFGLNSLFACLYLLGHGAIANARPGNFADAFFFSLETLATVGYGVMAPATLYGHIVSATEIVTGVAFTALLTGLVFGRFSRPKARILYAKHAVVCTDSGLPTLMLRIANGRATLLADARVRLTVLLAETTPEGQRFRRPHDLALTRDYFPLFALTWTLMHRIDKDSPLFGWTASRMGAEKVLLFLSLEARDVALAAQVHDIHAYGHEAILFGMRYEDSVSWDEQGRTLADLGKLSLIVPDEAPPDDPPHG